MTSRREMRSAANILQEVYGELLGRLTEAVVQNEEAMKGGAYSFTSQEIEDRFGPRVIHLGQLINALHNASQRQQGETISFESVIADADDLADELNEHLARLHGATLKDLNLQTLEDGRLLALLTIARPA